MAIVDYLIAIHSLVRCQFTGQFYRSSDRAFAFEKERSPGFSTISSAGNFMQNIPLGIVEGSTVLICQNEFLLSIHISIGWLYYHLAEVNGRSCLYVVSTRSVSSTCSHEDDASNNQYKNHHEQKNTSTQWYELHFSNLSSIEMVSLLEDGNFELGIHQ